MLSRTTALRAAGVALAAALASGATVATAIAPGTAAAVKPKVDLVFVIDTTGSMGPYINAVRASAHAITQQLFAHADARVALVDYKDLHQECPEDGYAAQLDLPFTTDPATFGPAVDGLAATGGCDIPESVYSGIMTGLELPWRAGARRAVLVMGDAPPHDPELVTGHTHASVTAAALAGGVLVVPQSPAARSLGADAIAKAMAEGEPPVTLHTVNIDGGGSPDFEKLAADTGGQTYPASDPSDAVDQIIEAITAITAGGTVVDAGGPYQGAVGEPVTFTASVTGGPGGPGEPAANGAVTGYDWDFDGDGGYDGTSTGSSITHTYLQPFAGRLVVRVTTDAEDADATDTADVRILTRARVKYTGQRNGLSGQRARLQAYVSGERNAKLAGVPVDFTLGSASCSAPTGADGQAACEVVVPDATGTLPVTATAQAPSPHLPATTTEPFTVKEPKRRAADTPPAASVR